MFTPPKTYPSIRDVQALAPHTMWIPQVASSVTGAMGSPVSALNSIGANTTGHHFTQGTSSARPTLQQDSNGTRYLQFSGSHFMAVPSSTAKFNFLHDGSDYCVFTAYSIDSASGVQVIINTAIGPVSGVQGYLQLYRSTGRNAETRMTNGTTTIFMNNVVSGSVETGTDTISVSKFESSENTTQIYSDELRQNTAGTTGSASTGNADGDMTIGRRTKMATLFMTGKFYGAVVFNRVPSAAETQLVVDMFAGMMRKQL